jgi:hypothetical protein
MTKCRAVCLFANGVYAFRLTLSPGQHLALFNKRQEEQAQPHLFTSATLTPRLVTYLGLLP